MKMTAVTSVNLSCLLSFYDTVKVYVGYTTWFTSVRSKELIPVSWQVTVINEAVKVAVILSSRPAMYDYFPSRRASPPFGHY